MTRATTILTRSGWKNGFEHGSHGLAHKSLSAAMKKHILDTNSSEISYEDAKKKGLDAIQKAGALHCDRKCLEAQVDAHYDGCKGKNLTAASGTGGGGNKSGQNSKRK